MNPASLKRRFLALVVDYVVILGYIASVVGVTVLGYTMLLGHIPNLIKLYGPVGAHAIGFFALTLPVMLYFIFSEASSAGASLGKKFARIRVNSISKERATAPQIVTRTIIKFLPWEIAHTAIYQLFAESQTSALTMALFVAANALPLLYVGTIILRKDHRGPHDLLAGTLVGVRSPV